MTDKRDKKAPTKKELEAEFQERMANAFYMLAAVIEKNTETHMALLVALEKAAEQPGAVEPAPELEAEEGETSITKDECQKILVELCGVGGKQGAFSLLQRYGAESLSNLQERDYARFHADGRATLKAVAK